MTVFRMRVRGTGGVSTDPPVITSSASVTIDEGSELAHQLTADKDINRVITGGADAALFEIESTALKFLDDAVGVTGVYQVTWTAYDSGNVLLFASQTITVTVVTIGATLPGVPSLSLDVGSEAELVVTTSATNAVSYEYELDGSGVWSVLQTSLIISGLVENTLYSVKTRGIGTDGLPGPASAADTETTEVMPAAFVPAKFRYDGTTSYLTRGGVPTGLVDGKTFTFSLLITFEGLDGTAQRIFTNASNSFRFRRNSDNTLEIFGQNAAGATILHGKTTQAYDAVHGRLHVLISVDLAADKLLFYVNDVAQTLGTRTATDDTIDMADTNFSICAAANGTAKTMAVIEEFFFHNTYLNIATLSNRRKFMGPAGNPRNLGADGSTPLGVQPLIYMKTGASPGTNSGSGGNFTVNGTIVWINDPGSITGFPSAQADHFVEFFSIQTHVERTTSSHSVSSNEADWLTTAWRQKFIDLGVRYSRSRTGRDPLSGAHIIALYNAAGIRFVTNVSVYNASNGTLNQSATDANFLFMENDVGLEKYIAVEGPNEYTIDKKFWKTISAVNTTSNLLTTSTAHGFSINQRVVLDWEATGTYPLPFTPKTITAQQFCAGQNYYVIADGFTSTALKVSLTQGGAAVDITTSGSGVFNISNWTQRVWDIQSYIWNYVTTRPAWSAIKVLTPSLWRRRVGDYLALGDLTSIAHGSNLHYYQTNRKPTWWNPDGPADNAPMDDAITEAQTLRPGGIGTYVGENGFDLATQPDPSPYPVTAYGGNVDQAVTLDLATDLWTTAVAHGLVANNQVYFVTTGSFTGITVMTKYFIISANLTPTTFKVSATQGGASVNVTAQSGTHRVGYAYMWSSDLATPDTVSKHVSRCWAEFFYRRTTPGVFKHNYYVFIDDHVTNHFGFINRHSYGGEFEERNHYWTVRNLIALMADPGVDFVTTQMDFTIDLAASPDLRWMLFKKRNGRFYLMMWDDIQVWKRNSPVGEITNARVSVPFQANAPTFTSFKIWEPTMLQSRGDSPSSGLSALSTDVTPMAAKTLSVPDHLQIYEFIP